MVGEKFLYQRMKVWKSSGDRKYDFLFRGKVGGDFQRKNLPNFFGPCFAIHVAGLQGTIQPHAQSQCMLMLAGKRDEIFIAKHAARGGQVRP